MPSIPKPLRKFVFGKSLLCVSARYSQMAYLERVSGSTVLHCRTPEGQVKGHAAAHHLESRARSPLPQMCRHPRPQLSHPGGFGQSHFVSGCPAPPTQQPRRCGTRNRIASVRLRMRRQTAKPSSLGIITSSSDAVCPVAERPGQISARLPFLLGGRPAPKCGSACRAPDCHPLPECLPQDHLTRYKQGRTPCTADTHGRGRTNRTVVVSAAALAVVQQHQQHRRHPEPPVVVGEHLRPDKTSRRQAIPKVSAKSHRKITSAHTVSCTLRRPRRAYSSTPPSKKLQLLVRDGCPHGQRAGDDKGHDRCANGASPAPAEEQQKHDRATYGQHKTAATQQCPLRIFPQPVDALAAIAAVLVLAVCGRSCFCCLSRRCRRCPLLQRSWFLWSSPLQPAAHVDSHHGRQLELLLGGVLPYDLVGRRKVQLTVVVNW